MFLALVVLGLARGAAKTSVVGLAKDDVCLGMETGACGLHALQVGQSKSPTKEKVITMSLQSQSTHGSRNEGQTALELLPRAHHLLRELLHRHLSGAWDFHQVGSRVKGPSSQQMLDYAASMYPQPPGMPMDQWIRDVLHFREQSDPAYVQDKLFRQKVLIVGFVILTILPLLVVMIEKKNKSSQPYETRPQTSQKITQKELEQHSTTSSLWLSIGGVVCDVTDFLMLHPGGNQVLLQYGGQEALEAFEEVGHSDFARRMLQEKAIGVLVDGATPLRGDGRSFLGRLFTREDGFNIHKSLGIFTLGHVFYRFYTKLTMQPDGGFTSSYTSLALCWMAIVLQSTSFFFEVPRARLLGSPMIWQEWRAHNYIFVLRHVLGFTITWGYLRWVSVTNHLAATMLDFAMFAVLYAQLYSVDVITAYIREDKHTSLTASWPFWDGCPIWLEKFIKWYYTIAQFQASTLLIMTGYDLYGKYLVIFPFQFASFLMTLVRKGIISTKGFHAGYLWSLWIVVWCIMDGDLKMHVATWILWILLYFFRSNGLSKYALWLGPLVPSVLIYYYVIPDDAVMKFPVMLLVWLVCITVQKLFMGFIAETRARRFLEARKKPLKLQSKEKVNEAFYLLKFEVPPGYTAGINPGQHVKVHVPNISKNKPSWNKHNNLEESVDELSRSYTPVSATTSPTMDLMLRLYPKDSDRGFPDGGRASTFLIEHLQVGQEMFLSGPHGHQLYYGQSKFLVGKNMVTARACGALAGGSGITPVLTTLQDIWQEGRRDIRDRDQRILGEKAIRMDEFAVLHVTRKASEALPSAWYEAPTSSSDITPIRVSHVVTSEDAEVPGVNKCWTGKLTLEMVQQALPAPGEDVVVFVCGPQGFNESLCRPMLLKLGYKHIVMLQ